MQLSDVFPSDMPGEPDWSDPEFNEVVAKRDKIFEATRKFLRLDRDTCPGCYLGDDGPPFHDMGYLCAYGGYGE